MRLRYTRQALRDLTAISEHIREQNPSAADRIGARIRERIERLQDFPFAAPTRGNARRLVISGTRYIVAYQVREQTIVILTVQHGARSDS